MNKILPKGAAGFMLAALIISSVVTTSSIWSYSGGIPSTGTGNGPASPGNTGSVKCVFTGSHNQATEWWLDSTTRPTIPALIHTVQVSPGTAVGGYAVGAHTIYFNAQVAGDAAPPPKAISVQAQKTTIIYVQYL